MEVTTANICGNPLRPKRAVRKRMRRALTQNGVVFGQEVAASNRWRRGNYSAMWVRVANALKKMTYGEPHEVPISLPVGVEVIGSVVILVHKGKKRVSPNRYITVVKSEFNDKKVAFVNCHPVSKPRRGVPNSAWRIQHWNLYHQKLVEVVNELSLQGNSVIFGGDMNKKVVPEIHPRQQTLVESGLDHLWIVPAENLLVSGVHITKIRRTLMMDHPILSASFNLS
jgi:hypothetical protein